MKEKIKIGYIGLGRRGYHVLDNCVSLMSDVEITAICDIKEEALQKTKAMLTEKGHPIPICTKDYIEVLENPDIDAVFIMIGWQGRADMAVKSMKQGKYTAIEVGCAFDLRECYELIETYEQTGSPLMMLENCCYGRREMMALNLVSEGLLGTVVHCDGGYHHLLPKMDLFKDFPEDESHYRIQSYIHRNCEQYPTHELGPIAKVLKLNRGNKMLTLSSHSSKSAGLKQYAKEILGEEHQYSHIDYKQGDIVTTIIHCAGGETIHICLDTTVPRAYYSRNFTVRGTDGLVDEARKLVYFKGMDEGLWQNESEMFEKYDHPLHKEYAKLGEKGGHGGIDYLVCRAFVESVKSGTDTPINAYDTVSWMAIGPLSEASIAMGGAPVAVPDFTKGKWVHPDPIIEGKYCLDKVCDCPDVKIY